MVAEEFLGLAGAFKLSTYVGLEDLADKLNFMFTVVLITLSLMVVTVKSYFFKPLACYIATVPTGSNFDDYMENYCWVHGTIPFLSGESIPQTPENWALVDATKRITYYQWVPFILGLQCIMFYIPKIIWQIICYNKIGTNLDSLVNNAQQASLLPGKDRKAKVEQIAKVIEDMLYLHRDYRQGKMAKIRRGLYDQCNFCICSKHLGTWLFLSYFMIKILYGINVIGQLYLMKSFLGFHSSIVSFGYSVLDEIANGRDWHQTGVFPRVSYCYNADIRHLGTSNTYVAQCALPINMLNEKIYIFLWFWIFLVGVVTLVSMVTWFVRIVFLRKRSGFIRSFLIMQQTYQNSENLQINQFVKEFLRYDGVFLLRMIFMNAGDIVASELVNTLWLIYKEKYTDLDFRNFNNYKKLTNNIIRDQSSNNSNNESKENFV